MLVWDISTFLSLRSFILLQMEPREAAFFLHTSIFLIGIDKTGGGLKQNGGSSICIYCVYYILLLA